MATVADFHRLSKIDYLNNLHLGMTYRNFVRWSDFLIPGFPENSPCLDSSLRDEVSFYTDLKVQTKQDFFNLVYLSISESMADSVKVLNGAVAFDFCKKFQTAANFIEVLKEIEEKYSNEIKIRPTLKINSNIEENLSLAEAFVDNKSIYGVYVVGNKFTSEKVENYRNILKIGRKNGLRTLLECRSLSKTEDLLFALKTYEPEALKDLPDELYSSEVEELIKQMDVKIVLSPATQNLKFMRKLADDGLKLNLCTDSFLFYKKSLSEFAADICNSALFTVEEMKVLFATLL
ncbi:MAG: hypothetical protein KBT11_00280 [Treponema sp.]|nr:hypothetical protein [Candidatus Treponema equifaecale]